MGVGALFSHTPKRPDAHTHRRHLQGLLHSSVNAGHSDNQIPSLNLPTLNFPTFNLPIFNFPTFNLPTYNSFSNSPIISS
jgi:hypothetical protein